MAKRTKRLTSQGIEMEEIRINRYLSDSGVCSRREADRYITEGKVEINGVIAQMGSKVSKDSQVTFLDKPVKRVEKLVLIAFNKPEGVVSTTDHSDPDNIVDYINYGMRIYPIGRLDKDSEGLILLTNDGNIVNKILRAENNHEKEYVVTVNKELNSDFVKSMSSGVPILNTVTKPCIVTPIDKYSFKIILTQGLNRQIRRMCEYHGYRVVKLTRIRIMNIQLGRLKPGDYRNVTEKEIEEINHAFQIRKGYDKSVKNEVDSNDDQVSGSGNKGSGSRGSEMKREHKDNRKSYKKNVSSEGKTGKKENHLKDDRKIKQYKDKNSKEGRKNVKVKDRSYTGNIRKDTDSSRKDKSNNFNMERTSEGTTSKERISKVRTSKESDIRERISKVSDGQERTNKVSRNQVSDGQERTNKVRSNQVRDGRERTNKVRSNQEGRNKVSTSKESNSKESRSKERSNKVSGSGERGGQGKNFYDSFSKNRGRNKKYF